MGQRRDRREGDTWADVVDCARLLLPHKGKRRSPERAAIETAITERCHIKPATQWINVRIFEHSINLETGEPTLPFRLHWSTARLLVSKQATYAELMRANDEGWTLARARAWAIDRTTKSASDKPLTLWHHLTRVIPAEIRRATGPVDERATLQALRDALRDWQEQIRGEQT